jgi:hypothetical protein
MMNASASSAAHEREWRDLDHPFLKESRDAVINP